MVKRMLLVTIITLLTLGSANAIYEEDAGVIYEENFNDGAFNTDYWTVITGSFAADGNNGTFLGDDPQSAYGTLSFGIDPYTEIKFDLYKLVVTDLGYDVNELGKITFEYDLAQTNGTGGGYRFNTYLHYSGENIELEASPEGDRDDPNAAGTFRYADTDPNTATSFVSLDGLHTQRGAGNDGVAPLQRLNVAQWGWQRMKYTFDVEEYFTTRVYQDYDMDGDYVYVAYAENWHPNSGNTPWPYIENINLMNRDGISWFVDNVKVTLDNPYLGWDKIFEDDFEDGDYNGWTIGSGYWTVAGSNEPAGLNGTDPCAPWGAIPGKMASADPNAYIKTSISATTPGHLVAISCDVQQMNGTNLDFPVFLGFGDVESDDYYVEYVSPATTYGGTSGAMVMKADDPNGNGIDPFLSGNDDWWSFDVGEPGKVLTTSKTHLDLVFNPWEDYPSGSIRFYIDGELAAKWTNFRGIYSFNEIFFGMRNNDYEEGIGSNVPCWNFDNIRVYSREAKCGDAGYKEFDFNQDCTVNIPDFAIFAEQWLECTDPQNINCFQ